VKTALANWRRPGDPEYRLTIQRNAPTLIIYVCQSCHATTCSRHYDHLVETGWVADRPPKNAVEFQRMQGTCPKCAPVKTTGSKKK
jgi:hypothetical protein